MADLTLSTVEKLINFEKQIRYDELPNAGQLPFEVIVKNESILISAPHGAKTFRNNKEQVWHEEDEYTAGMALVLSEICDVSAIVMKAKCPDYDPNYTVQENVPYKCEIKRLIKKNDICFVIDLHGAALFSPTLDDDQTIDLGTRQKNVSDESSFNLHHVEKFEDILSYHDEENLSTNFVVRRNRFPAAGPGTITTFSSQQKIPNTEINVQALQIEMKPQVRVARRFASSTLYNSCGPYEADPKSILHMLQSLVNFIDYLKNKRINTYFGIGL